MRIAICLIPFLFFACKKHINHDNKTINAKQVAVEGYDIVAYHVEDKAIAGSSKWSTPIGEVYYYFSSEKNQELFAASPEKYLPKYGGFCAIGIALYDGKYDIDPLDFLIDEGELYLFCPGEIDNWIADQEHLKKQADLKWAEMEAQKKEEAKQGE